jgi:murein L,D-transpeptidase YafK
MAGRAIVLILIVALGGVVYYLLTPEGRYLIDRARIKIVRYDHLSRFHSGDKLHGTPDLEKLDERFATQGVELGAPIYLRIFKLEFEFELWVYKEGRFVRFATYPICRWPGHLGPKLHKGDRQAPEGFYTVSAKQVNASSRNHRSLDLGYPNLFDRAHGRTGFALQVHGGCRTEGCYAMTDAVIEEIWRFVSAALEQGQPRVPVHVFPFRMTDRNVSLRRGYEWEGFWADLKKGYDLFEQTGLPPVVSVCKDRYVFAPASTETFATAVKEGCPPGFAGNSIN